MIRSFNHKHNNFDFLRFLFAVFVVISHSYPLSGTHESSQWIYQITNGQTVLARIGLNGFFVISGYFIFQSLVRSKNIYSYYKKRFLRLFPALFVVLFISLLLGSFIYTGSQPYFKNKEVLAYLPNNLSLYNFQGVIRGIFDDNPYHAINGSLWTIRYEFSLYIALSVLFFLKRTPLAQKLFLVSAFLVFLFIFNFYLSRVAGASILGMLGYEILDLGTFFICGSLLAVLKFEKINKKPIILILSFLMLVISFYFEIYNALKHILFPIIVLLIGFIPLSFFSTFGKVGDMSYGIYIYSFPVQQTLMYFFKFEVYELTGYSLVISILLGYLSWHLIEKRALKYKNKPLLILNKRSG